MRFRCADTGRAAAHDSLFIAGLDDYVADVEHVAGGLDAPPILIGHSMGAAICERMMATRPVRGAALLAPVPPAGLLPVAARLAAMNPTYLSHMAGLDPSRLTDDVLKVLRPFYFSEGVDRDILQEAIRHLNGESPRVLFDLALRLHWALPHGSPSPVLVLGAHDDRIAIPEDVRATAAHHRVEAGHPPRHGTHADARAGMGARGAGHRTLGRDRGVTPVSAPSCARTRRSCPPAGAC